MTKKASLPIPLPPLDLTRRQRSQWKVEQFHRTPTCAYCKQRVAIGARHGFAEATVDHIIPLSKYGADQVENYALSCAACNSAKRSGEYPNPFLRHKLTGECV